MVAPVFGWSTGDIALGVRTARQIYKAFKQAGGAEEQFKESTAFLHGFERTLQVLRTYLENHDGEEQTDMIEEQVKLLEGPGKTFKMFLEPFEKALGEGSDENAVKKAFRTVKWSLKQFDGEVQKLKTAVVQPMSTLNIALVLAMLKIWSAATARFDIAPSLAEQVKDALDLVDLKEKLNNNVSILQESASQQGESTRTLLAKVEDIRERFDQNNSQLFTAISELRNSSAAEAERNNNRHRETSETLRGISHRDVEAVSNLPNLGNAAPSQEQQILVQEQQIYIMRLQIHLEQALKIIQDQNKTPQITNNWALWTPSLILAAGQVVSLLTGSMSNMLKREAETKHHCLMTISPSPDCARQSVGQTQTRVGRARDYGHRSEGNLDWSVDAKICPTHFPSADSDPLVPTAMIGQIKRGTEASKIFAHLPSCWTNYEITPEESDKNLNSRRIERAQRAYRVREALLLDECFETSNHPLSSIHRCMRCDESFPSRTALTKHCERFDPSSVWCCTSCEYVSISLEQMVLHQTGQHHELAVNAIANTDKSKVRATELEISRICAVCSYQNFTDAESYYTHVANATEEVKVEHLSLYIELLPFTPRSDQRTQMATYLAKKKTDSIASTPCASNTQRHRPIRQRFFVDSRSEWDLSNVGTWSDDIPAAKLRESVDSKDYFAMTDYLQRGFISFKVEPLETRGPGSGSTFGNSDEEADRDEGLGLSPNTEGDFKDGGPDIDHSRDDHDKPRPNLVSKAEEFRKAIGDGVAGGQGTGYIPSMSAWSGY